MTDLSRIDPAHLAEMVMEAEELGIAEHTIEEEFYSLISTVDPQTKARIEMARDYWRTHRQQLVAA